MQDPPIRDHQAWLGYLQPDGLVVSPAALVDCQVILPRSLREEQEAFLAFLAEAPIDFDAPGGSDRAPVVADLPALLRGWLGWPNELIYGLDPARPLPERLSVPLREFGDVLEPTLALADTRPRPADNGSDGPNWLLLVQDLALGTDLDAPASSDARAWSASPARRFERLLRETGVPIGLLANGTQLRLMYAPRGENAGSLTFPVAAMTEIAGRPILGALHMLLKGSRLLAGPAHERLPAVLARSRAYQSTVSTRLAEQVMEALFELLRGLQAADERSGGTLLKDTLARDPDSIYGGLLNVLLRLVFLLYAEDRGLMPATPLYVQNYSLHGLFEKLRADAQGYPDTMDHRYGAWARLLALFRAVHGGCGHPLMRMPAREGYLFDPERFPFLEGRGRAQPGPGGNASLLPLIADGVIWRVLDKLLLLDGERLSYRTLDVEQIGSVYESVMGFRLEVAQGPTVALKPPKRHGAPPAVDLAVLLAQKPAERAKWLALHADQKLDAKAEEALKAAASVDDLLAALERRIHRGATPSPVAAGALILQPSNERRRSGSHYTPRSLTEPIVARTLDPVLARLAPDDDQGPTPEHILELKVCDLAAGSGAFLVAACRRLGEALVCAWHAHGRPPVIPEDEDETLLARRLVAQRCLYGVDKNPLACDLAKLSLWLATLARDHPFTFLDHAIRAGDSLVGLARRQIEDFHWEPARPAAKQRAFGQDQIGRRIAAATAARREILEAGDDLAPALKAQKLAVADSALELVRLVGDLVVAAFFAADKDKTRGLKRDALLAELTERLREDDLLDLPEAPARALRSGERPVMPFHWEIEFPEVFQRDPAGFDAIVGNPPFAGKNTLIDAHRDGYLDWLKTRHPESHGNSDLVAHFFRRAFDLLRAQRRGQESAAGCLGLIATNTIGQGDTRATGLRWLRRHGGTIYWARKRYKWPGEAAVVVSVVHLMRGLWTGPVILDGREVPVITAYLFHAGGDEDPARLEANAGKSFIGSYVLGMGFTFDDTDAKGVASALADMHRLIEKDPRNAERIFPYIGGEEVNDSPTQSHRRYVINFEDFPLRRADLGTDWAGADERRRKEWLRAGIVPLDYPEPVAADWPDLLEIVERKVKPERDRLAGNSDALRRKGFWWLWGRYTPALFETIRGVDRALVISRVSQYAAFSFAPADRVFAETLVVFPFVEHGALAIVQSRVHESWALFFASSLEERLRYGPSDCFETFPFPEAWETDPILESAGRAYHAFRAELMVRNNEGLTKTYNRFHDPAETDPDILKLRALHAAMDRAVLDAYGWHDIPTDCDFILEWDDEDDESAADPASFNLQPPSKRPAAKQRKKPYRLRWPDAIRDEVLARLLALNALRAAQEARAGASAMPVKRGGKRRALGPDLLDGLA